MSSSKGVSYYNMSDLKYGYTGSKKLSLKPGYYNITPELKIKYKIGNSTNLISHYSILRHNLTGKFITTIVNPGVSEFELPVTITMAGFLLMSILSQIEYRRFIRLFK